MYNHVLITKGDVRRGTGIRGPIKTGIMNASIIAPQPRNILLNWLSPANAYTATAVKMALYQ